MHTQSVDNVEPLYFLTLVTVLVLVLGLAVAQTVKKRRGPKDDAA